MNLTDIINNQHFQNFAALLRVPFTHLEWRQEHAEVPFWTLVNDAERPLKIMEDKALTSDAKNEFLHHFTRLITAVVESDPALFYTKQDVEWLVSVLDGDAAPVTLRLLFAYFSASTDWLTPQEIAEITNTHESGWRNRAANGEIPGAFKKGKTWLIQAATLRAMGYDIPTQPVASE